jgi:hypothetical protein
MAIVGGRFWSAKLLDDGWKRREDFAHVLLFR